MASISLDELQSLTRDEVISDSGYWSQSFLQCSYDLSLPNCTNFCVGAWAWCVNSSSLVIQNNNGNACNWYKNLKAKGYSVGATPKMASILCLDDGSYGHVVFVYDYEDASDRYSEGWYHVYVYGSSYRANKNKDSDAYFYKREYYINALNQDQYAKDGDGNNTQYKVQGFVYHPTYTYTTYYNEETEEGTTRQSTTSGSTKTYKLVSSKETITSIEGLTSSLISSDAHWDSGFVSGGRSASRSNACAAALGAWSWCYGALVEDQDFEKFLKRGTTGYPQEPRYMYSEYAFDKSSNPSLGALVCLDATDSYPYGRVGLVTTFSNSDSKTIISFFNNSGGVENITFATAPTAGCTWSEAGGGYCPGYMTHKYFKNYRWVVKTS